ncbi:hypothetical protein B4099_1400 [Heyndrickxia coagulans]|uniref:Uncharacterized protein n=1 Tax=Heyndrickxia coagulans TaxID=1398 RepID=A0A150KJS4_HEYCO|nr:hypothetical protein B4099_1400 [Heyndrickxia coagulans]
MSGSRHMFAVFYFTGGSRDPCCRFLHIPGLFRTYYKEAHAGI